MKRVLAHLGICIGIKSLIFLQNLPTPEPSKNTGPNGSLRILSIMTGSFTVCTEIITYTTTLPYSLY